MLLCGLFNGSYFGRSRKQGVSLRMPLSTCAPTELCANACYAHDVLDATPASVVRGVVCGWIASFYESGSECERAKVFSKLLAHSQRAVRLAKKEMNKLPSGFARRPNIRFSHVGELARFPQFSNALARQIRDVSNKGVDCVIYTRHQKATELDPKIWIINFTIDSNRTFNTWF